MYYRAIKRHNYGAHLEMQHFDTLRDAYMWLLPPLEQQASEGWHIRLLWVVISEFKKWNSTFEKVGYKPSNSIQEGDEEYLYIQKVNTYDEPIVKF